MWVLTMILYVASTGVTHHPRIANYDTLDDCTSRAAEITASMMDAYPGDTDTWFTCTLEHV